MRRVVLAPVLVALVALVACTATEEPVARSTGSPSASAPAPPTTPAAPVRSGATCSATDVDAPLPSQPGLPEPVARLRAEVDAAAGDCDYARLEALALAGDGEFTASFGDPGPPGAFWRQQEESGQAPLRRLRQVLRTSPAETGGDHVWPAAFARDSWQEVPAEERAELAVLYDERDLRAFEQFGAYVGHRVVITPDGDWVAFVAGD